MDPIIKKVTVKSVITKSNLPVCDYAVNPYVGCTHACRYCYASFMKRFTNHIEPWGEFLDVKYWSEISHPERYKGKEIFIGSVTDPYLPQEEVYRRTRALLEQLQGSGARINIATKSDLILRDIDLLKTFPGLRIAWSINTLDESFKCDMDNAVSIERRLAAMDQFHKSGICTVCFISPIFPEITDVKAIIERVKKQCNFIWLENLNLRGSYKAVIFDYIRQKHPDLLSLYKNIYSDGDHFYWRRLDMEIRSYAAEIGLRYVTNDDSIRNSLDDLPVIVNFFYHDQIKKNAKARIVL